jgi:hypothetical protein
MPRAQFHRLPPSRPPAKPPAPRTAGFPSSAPARKRPPKVRRSGQGGK